MSDFSISGIIEGDSSGFQDAINQASGALSSFLELAGGVAAGEQLSNVFSGVIDSVVSSVSAITATASEFQDWGAVINDVGSQTSDMYSNLADAGAKSGASQAASALEAADALAKYNEKVQEIQDNISTVMQGQNVIDAQTTMYDRLDALATTYGDKVQQINDQIAQAQEALVQKEADQQQSMNNTLQDMTDSHNDQVFNTTAEYTQKMNDTKSTVEKAALQKQLDDKLALMNKEFANTYSTKQSELERNLEQQKAADQRATDQKVASLNDQLAKATDVYNQQVAKEKEAGDKAVSNAEAQNQKKLAQYQRELADEERSYELSLAKRAAAGAKSGGGGSSSAGLLKLDRDVIEVGDSLAKTKQSGADLLDYMDRISNTTPFNLEDLEQVGEKFTMANVDAASMLPTIENLAGHFHQSLGTTADAVLMAMHGRAMTLKNDFNITGQTMDDALGRPVKTSNDVLEAVKKIGENQFSDGIKVQSDQSSSEMIKMHNQITKVVLAIAGISEATGKPIKGGMFDEMMQHMQKFTDFLMTHKPEIEDFGKKAITIFMEVGKVLSEVAQFIIDNWQYVWPIFVTIGIAFAILFGATVVAAVALLVSTFGAFAVTAVGVSVVATLVAGVIFSAFLYLKNNWVKIWAEIQSVIKTAVNWISENFATILMFIAPGSGILIQAITFLGSHWQQILSDLQKAWNDFWSFLGNIFNNIMKALDDVGKKAGNALSFLNPFAHHSPSLVEQIRDGVDLIKSIYGEVGNMQINAPSINGIGGSGSQVYNSTYNTVSPNISMSNVFSVGSQANASNIAEYLAYQLLYKGLV